MKLRSSLRFRVMLSFALLGAGISTTMAAALYVLTTHMEERLITETLSAELEDYMGRFALNPSTAPPSSTTIRSYVFSAERGKGVPDKLYELQPGLHRIDLDGTGHFAEIRSRQGMKFAVLYDDSAIRHRETQFKMFLLGGLFIMTLLSGLLGWWLARRVTYPVGELARRVADLKPESGSIPLAKDFPRDEVGRLARDFDDYQQRLAKFIEREQAFTGDVSHELRTPLAVIEGAVEVLLADSELDEQLRIRVERIARAAREASELTQALLLLAREEDGKAVMEAECKVEDELKQVVGGHVHARGQEQVSTELYLNGHPVLSVEPVLLRVVLGNLVRNAYTYTQEGSVTVTLLPDGVTIADTGVGMDPAELARIFERHYSGNNKGGAGIGLSLVKRICRNYGWTIDISSKPNIGTIMRLSFKQPGSEA